MHANKALIILLIMLGFMVSTELCAADSHKFRCSQNVSKISGLKFLSMDNLSGDIRYYYFDNDSILINGLKMNPISYLFWKNQYLGFIVYVNNKKNIFNIKKFLYGKYKYVIEASGKTTAWQTDDEIVVFKKFSLHQGKVIYLCKDLYLQMASGHRDYFNY